MMQKVCIAAAAILAALVVAGPVLADTSTPATLPAVFAGVAEESALFEHFDSTPSVAPVSQPVYASFGEGTSDYSPETLTATASPYNPGAAVTGLGGLLCTAGAPTCNTPPFPLLATANQQNPDANVTFTPEVGAGGPLAIGTMSGSAHVNAETGVSTTSSVGDIGESQGSSSTRFTSLAQELSVLLGHPVAAANSSLLHIGSLSGTTSQSFNGNTLTVTATAKDSDISLLGGILDIGSISATSTTVVDGGKVHTHTDDATASGVTVAGVPASIDQEGISIQGTGLGGTVLSAANAALQQALSAAGMTLHFLGHTSGEAVLDPQLCTDGEADGLQLHVQADLTAIPLEGAVFYDDIAIGSACTTASEGPPPVSTSGTPTPVATGTSGSSSPSTGTGSSFSGGTGTSTGSFTSGATSAPSSPVALGSTGTTGTSPPLAATAPAGRRGKPVAATLGTALVSHRLSLLYLVFGLTFLAALLGATPFLKPRLPRGS
jgi:hypothetical protein